MSCTCLIASFIGISTLYPVIDSSLSIVPPVKPSPLPLILHTPTPREATIGKTIRVTLSPTPPVECLSTMYLPGTLILDKSRVLALFAIEKVKSFNSVGVIPFKYIAINSADI